MPGPFSTFHDRITVSHSLRTKTNSEKKQKRKPSPNADYYESYNVHSIPSCNMEWTKVETEEEEKKPAHRSANVVCSREKVRITYFMRHDTKYENLLYLINLEMCLRAFDGLHSPTIKLLMQDLASVNNSLASHARNRKHVSHLFCKLWVQIHASHTDGFSPNNFHFFSSSFLIICFLSRINKRWKCAEAFDGK